MTETALLKMISAPQDGWDDLVGTFWVLMGDGKRVRHVTERQSTITVTMKSRDAVWKHFERVTR